MATDRASGLHLGPTAWLFMVKSMAEAGLGAGAGVAEGGGGGAGKGHVYNLWDCFQHIINSDYWLQISAGNQRVTGFYGAVERTSAVSGVTSPLVCSAVLSILPSFDAREQRKIGKCPQVREPSRVEISASARFKPRRKVLALMNVAVKPPFAQRRLPGGRGSLFYSVVNAAADAASCVDPVCGRPREGWVRRGHPHGLAAAPISTPAAAPPGLRLPSRGPRGLSRLLVPGLLSAMLF